MRAFSRRSTDGVPLADCEKAKEDDNDDEEEEETAAAAEEEKEENVEGKRELEANAAGSDEKAGAGLEGNMVETCGSRGRGNGTAGDGGT